MNELLKMILQSGMPQGMGGMIPGMGGGQGNSLQSLLMPQQMPTMGGGAIPMVPQWMGRR